MKNLAKFLKPNYFRKTPMKTMFLIYLAQVVIALIFLQSVNDEMIPKPFGVFREALNIISKPPEPGLPSFGMNFVSTLWFILKGMGISVLISLVICYLFKMDALKGIAYFVSKLRFLTYTGIAFVANVMLHNAGTIKLSVLLCGIIPYFVTTLLAYFEDINEEEYKLCYTLKMNEWQTLYEVVIKGKMDLVFEVIRQNFAIAWMMITSVETLAWSEGGIGTMLVTENRHFRMERVFAILTIILLTGIFFDYIFNVLKVYFFPYSNPDRYEKLWLVQFSRMLSKRKQFTDQPAKTTTI